MLPYLDGENNFTIIANIIATKTPNSEMFVKNTKENAVIFYNYL